MERGSGLWIITFSLGILMVFVFFLVLTARPDLQEASGQASAAAGQAGAAAVRQGWSALGEVVWAVRARVGL